MKDGVGDTDPALYPFGQGWPFSDSETMDADGELPATRPCHRSRSVRSDTQSALVSAAGLENFPLTLLHADWVSFSARAMESRSASHPSHDPVLVLAGCFAV